jgi:hypothetical protein
MELPRVHSVVLALSLLAACDNSGRNERIADVDKKPVEDADEAKRVEQRKQKRIADEQAKSEAEELVRVEIAKIAVLPAKLPKKLDEACQSASDAHDRFMQRTLAGEELAGWNAKKENELPMSFVQCASADSIEAASCQASALDAASPALKAHYKDIVDACISKFAPARPSEMVGGGGGAIPKKRPR